MVAYAAQAQHSKPTQGSTASMLTFCAIRKNKMKNELQPSS